MTWLYLKVSFPFVWWWKFGITKHQDKRQKQVSSAVPGWAIPVFAAPVPFALKVEKKMHRRLRFLACRFYRGDGSTEWYWFPVVPLVLIVQAAAYAFWIGLFFGVVYLLKNA